MAEPPRRIFCGVEIRARNQPLSPRLDIFCDYLERRVLTMCIYHEAVPREKVPFQDNGGIMNLVDCIEIVEPFVLELGSEHSGTVIHAATVQYTWFSMHISIHQLQFRCFGVTQENSPHRFPGVYHSSYNTLYIGDH